MSADTVSPTPSAEPGVEEIRARADAATPGPWSADGTCEPNDHALRRYALDDEDAEPQLLGLLFDEVAPGDMVDGEANAEFIAHARTDIPALLSSLAEARRERDELRGIADELAAIAEFVGIPPRTRQRLVGLVGLIRGAARASEGGAG